MTGFLSQICKFIRGAQRKRQIKSLLRIAGVPIGLAAAGTLTLFTCTATKKYTSRFFAFDTVIDVTIYSVSPDAAREIDSLKNLCARLEDKFSISRPESEIYKINHRSDSVVTVSDTLAAVLSVCRKEYSLSDSLFDITVEPLKYLYGLESHQDSGRVPTPAEIDSVLSVIGFGKVRFISDSTLSLPRGMHLDFGGIAKGFVLVAARKYLLAKGYRSFMFNAGGDLVAVGCKPDGKPWNIGIQNPRTPDSLVATLPVSDQCVFTSGDYERFFIRDSIRFHHLFNPKTGIPGRYNSSSTVIGTDPLVTDAVVKAAFLMPIPLALRYLNSEKMAGLLIDSKGVGWANEAMRGLIRPQPGFTVNFK